MTAIAEQTSVARVQESSGCCDRIQYALGRCWEWIVDCWHWVVDRVFRVVDAAAFAVFRAVECFSPNLAMRMEAGYGYLATWYARHKAAVREKGLGIQLSHFETNNRNLNRQVEELQVERERLNLHVNRLKEERDEAITAKDRALSQVDQHIDLTVQLSQQVNTLQKELQAIQMCLKKTEIEKNNAIESLNAQSNQLKTAVEQLQDLQNQLNQSRSHTHLSEKLSRIEEIYQQNSRECASATEKELEELIPMYEKQEDSYRLMLEQAIAQLGPDDATRIPLQGFLKISKEKSGHIARISKSLHLHKELRNSLLQFFTQR